MKKKTDKYVGFVTKLILSLSFGCLSGTVVAIVLTDIPDDIRQEMQKIRLSPVQNRVLIAGH